MKKIGISLIVLLLITVSVISYQAQNNERFQSSESIYDIKINTIEGTALDLDAFKGKKILFVNVASECGFTPQYEDLQTLHENYQDKLVVIGIPCNQFGSQEPGSHEEISEFCETTYGITFIMTEKVDVKGDGQHPLYTWLTKKEKNGVKNSKVKWNFQKYIVDEKGEYVDFFYSATGPLSSKITELI